MSHDGLSKMTKIEVVASGADAPAIRELFRTAGATGFTSLSGVRTGRNKSIPPGAAVQRPSHARVVDHGRRRWRRSSRCSLGCAGELLAESSGVMFVDTYVSRPEYFR